MNESMKLKDKVALITGGGKGMGRAIGLAFATEGANIVVNDLDYSNAQKVATEIQSLGRQALANGADVSDSQAVDRMVEQAVDEFGYFIHSRDRGHSTRHDAHVVRHFSSEDGQELMGGAPRTQSLDVVGRGGLIHLFRKPVIAFVTRHERFQRSTGDELFHRNEVRVVSLVVGTRCDVDIVESGQVIEMKNVRLQKIGTEDKIAEYPPVVGKLAVDAESVV